MIGSDKVFGNTDCKSLSHKLKSKALKVSVKENVVPTEKNSSRAIFFATKASYISN